MKRILVVDDNPKNIQIVSNILSKNNYEIEYAQNGEEAVSIVQEESFDLILMDVMMPKMDGYEACEKIKKIEYKSEIPLIFLTSRVDAESVTQGFKAGGVDYVFKPFNTDELLARVQTHISLKDTRDQLFYKNQQQNESLQYAQRIQKALLPSDQKLNEIFPNHFLIYKPKDIIGGDFYWMRKIDHKVIIAVADCTGHGVPGALMSMLGVSMLNEIGDKTTSPAFILEYLRNRLSESWKQEDGYGEIADGMDISITIIDTNNLTMRFAGALSSAIIIRGDELIEIKGDLQPIGHFHAENDFNNHEIALKENDKLYFFSDGFHDQLGGKRYRTFKKKNFRDLLLNLKDYSMEEQKSKILEVHKKWKGNNESTDDILILGIHFKEIR